MRGFKCNYFPITKYILFLQFSRLHFNINIYSQTFLFNIYELFFLFMISSLQTAQHLFHFHFTYYSPFISIQHYNLFSFLLSKLLFSRHHFHFPVTNYSLSLSLFLCLISVLLITPPQFSRLRITLYLFRFNITYYSP